MRTYPIHYFVPSARHLWSRAQGVAVGRSPPHGVCVCVCVCCKHVSSLRFWFMFVCDVCWQPASLSSPTSPRRAFLCLTGQFVSLPPTPSHPFTPYVCVCVRARMLCVCVCVRYSYSVAQHLATSPPTPRTMRWCCHNCTRQVTNCR